MSVPAFSTFFSFIRSFQLGNGYSLNISDFFWWVVFWLLFSEVSCLKEVNDLPRFTWPKGGNYIRDLMSLQGILFLLTILVLPSSSYSLQALYAQLEILAESFVEDIWIVWLWPQCYYQGRVQLWQRRETCTRYTLSCFHYSILEPCPGIAWSIDFHRFDYFRAFSSYLKYSSLHLFALNMFKYITKS